MLQHLSIQNVALIRSLSLALGQGLNVLSGETGAGKSILIDAVNLVLGVRGDRDLIQHGAGRAMVEAVFIDARPEINACLEEMGIEPDAEITLSRVLYATGRNVCRINGVLVNNAALRQIAELLIDIHGQHEHQSLLRTAEHIGLLDAFGELLKAPASFLGLPHAVIPTALVRLVSNSAATGLVLDLFKEYGTESRVGLMASILMGSTETVLYCMSIYFGSVGIRKTRYTLAGGLLASAVGLAASAVLSAMMV